jgi:predicted peptidase
MKKLLPLILTGCFTLFISISCKKAIEKKAQDMIMDAITDGEWIVEQYIEGSNNVSNQFLNYSFRFFKDGTVTGTISSTTTNGTWVGNASDYTISSDFPTAGDPVKKLNGLWKIKDSYWDFVKAEMATANGTNVLKLRKK